MNITNEMLNGLNAAPLRELCALHLLGYKTANGFTSEAREMGYYLPADFRQSITSDASIMESIKFGYYRTACQEKFASEAHKRKFALMAGLNEDDLDLIDFEAFPRLFKHARTLHKHYKALNVTTFKRSFERVVKEKRNNINAFIRTKLQFIKNWGYTEEDIRLELQTRVYRNLLIHYPRFDNYAHFENLYLRSTRQQGLNLIKDCTYSNRNIFMEDGRLLIDSLSAFDNSNNEVDGIERNWGDSANESCLGDGYGSTLLSQISRLVTGREERMVQLLMGVRSENFESWLYSKDRELARSYKEGNLSRETVIYLLDYLNLDYASYAKVSNLALGRNIPVNTYTNTLRI